MLTHHTLIYQDLNYRGLTLKAYEKVRPRILKLNPKNKDQWV